MSSDVAEMQVTIIDRSVNLRERLRDRLDAAARLQCADHNRPVVAVTIHERENGWFDTMWTTCCESLERRAMEVVRQRC
jgi:hypothetical protein